MNNSATTIQPELVGLGSVAIMLDVSEKTVRRMIEDGDLGSIVKVRGSTKLLVKYVRAYMERLETTAERKW